MQQVTPVEARHWRDQIESAKEPLKSRKRSCNWRVLADEKKKVGLSDIIGFFLFFLAASTSDVASTIHFHVL